ncbi:hypothetical protein F4553_001945 [Allocatelliglobosispora scoriae]|uniref:Sporulation protein n=1 Tax=Allocatelliglobosispora scoriae TaxID=643052 RepID=A0A841BMR9_9ACTN|nr:hypothetical protein [Allocatelliglobosispora scoriae]MBB5868566.1 hypothetical protein [Allocatelliglobosispora scoriae]
MVVQILGQILGRTVGLVEAGFTSTEVPDARTGIEYGADAEAVIGAVGRLWRADLDAVRAVITAPANSAAWTEASLNWLVRDDTDPLPKLGGTQRVGASDVLRLRATTELFAQLDNRFGGVHSRRSLVQYLETEVSTLLAGNYTAESGRGLFGAAAEATLLAAWMSYDAGIQGLAQRYFIQALQLAQISGDVLLAGSVLDAMSHQATYLGQWHQAANLARAARAGTRGLATATLTAHFHAMEARATAVGGDSVATQRALGEAVRAFERRSPGDDPNWISYFDDAELAAEFSHCFRDIGRAKDTVTYAQRALANVGTSPRSDFFVTMVLATGHLQQGEIEQACHVVQSALTIGEQVQSVRCVEYLRTFRAALAEADSPGLVAALDEWAAEHRLWIASSSVQP